ncbi:hypothetical protein JHK84_043011 [Glycine max]|nr:hypothetical protein JHK84_043011 [Glycine max]
MQAMEDTSMVHISQNESCALAAPLAPAGSQTPPLGALASRERPTPRRGLPLHSAASPSESSLISKLQSSDSPGIHALVSDYLHPLSDLKPTKKSNPDQTLIRSLAKCFLSFLNASLSILPKWFLEVSKSNNVVSLLELLRVYKICLDCLDVVASQLGSKPFFVEFQRLRLIHCLESCGLFDEAQLEGLGVLEKPPPAKWKGKLLPEIDKGSGEGKELCSLVVDIVVSLLRCAAAGLAKEDAHFRKKTRKYYSVSDLEIVDFKVLTRMDQYEIREVENTTKEKMEMTTPVFTSKMEITTPVL